jgi:transposase
MKKKRYFIGFDVAKKTLAVSVYAAETKQYVFNSELENKPATIAKLFADLSVLLAWKVEEIFCCLEHTGVYSSHLLAYLGEQKITTAVEDALELKLSTGRQRGKSDPIDAKKIAKYACEKQDELRLWEPEGESLKQLKYLLSTRKLLLKQKVGILKRISETQPFDSENAKRIESACQKTIAAIKEDLDALDVQISELVEKDVALKTNFDLAVSIKGVGKVTAWFLLLYTRNFTRFDSGKQLACYAGVVPHPNESGAKKGRWRVSKMANQTLKSVLHMAALSAIRCNKELKTYFERKVKEGKNKMSVVNAVRNKLVLTIWAVVKKGEAWVEKTLQATQKNPAIELIAGAF